MSFKQQKKLFAIYQDSIKHFKDQFFIVKPLTQEVEDHLFEIVDYVEDEEQKRRPSARFPLEWKYDHFQQGTDAYIFRDKDLGDRDMAVYRKLTAFVNKFRRGTCTLPNRDPLFGEDEHPLLSSRYINTKAVLECETEGEAMILLGNICYDSILFVCLFLLTLFFIIQDKWLICMTRSSR